MRGAGVVTAVILSAAAVLGGCARQHPQAGAAASGSPADPGAAAPCPGGRPATQGRLTITAADNAKSFCVARGTDVVVLLNGTPARKWSPIRASGGALRPRPNGELTLALAVTGASFEAVRPGTAYILSGRPACGPGVTPGDGAAGTGTLSCDAILAFRVTVSVVS